MMRRASHRLFESHSAEGPDEAVRDVLRAVVGSDDRIDPMVLFGSVARGEDRPDSDVDLLVDGVVAVDVHAWTHLRGALLEKLGRPVGLLSVDEARRAPEVLIGVLRDGEVVKDRSGRWTALLQERERIEAEARRVRSTYPARKAAALARLAEGSGRA